MEILSLWVGRSVWWRQRNQRGDVPGWVLITVMTVGLVAIISTVAGDELRRLLRSALRSVG